MTAEIRQIHATSKGTYGSPRVYAELRDNGTEIGRRRVTRLMRQADIVGLHKRRWRKTTVVDPAAERARDLIGRDFAPGPITDRRYVGDITYIPTWEGFAYLATVIDLASRRAVGWSIANHMRTEFVEDSLKIAFVQRRPERGVIFHTDRGSQTELKPAVATPRRRRWRMRVRDRQRAVFNYIEGWYNTRRRHSSLGYKSPAVFEAINQSVDRQAA